MTNQELFNEAYKQYTEITGLIDTVSEFVQKTENEDFKARVAKKEYDLILQTILYTVAIQQYKISNVECQFIDKITDYGDILVYVNKELDTNLSWSDIPGLPRKYYQNLLKVMLKCLQEWSDDLVGSLAGTDATLLAEDSDMDLLKMLVNSINGICVNFIAISGDANDDKIDLYTTALQTILIEPWLKERKKFQDKYSKLNF